MGDLQRAKARDACQFPRFPETQIACSPQQFTGFERRIELPKRHDLTGRNPPRKMLGREFARVIESSGGSQFNKRLNRRAMKIGNTLQFVRDDQRTLTRAILGGDTGWAAIGMAALRLDAAQREHEPAGGIAPVGSERHCACNIERRGDLSARADFDPIADTDPNERIVCEGEPVPERHSEMA